MYRLRRYVVEVCIVGHGMPVQVRREAMRCLGLYCLLDHNDTPLIAPLEALRAALISWKPSGDTAEVASVAAEVGIILWALLWHIRDDNGQILEGCNCAFSVSALHIRFLQQLALYLKAIAVNSLGEVKHIVQVLHCHFTDSLCH